MMSEIPHPKPLKAALGYLRISDKKQIKGESKKNQKEQIEKYAKANNIKVVQWFFDEAKSGKNTERKMLQELLKVATKMKGQIDYVIVYKMNRASRDLDSYVIGMRSVLASKGIEVRSATEQFDDSPMGNFMQNLYVMVGQLDNENKRETVVDNMTRLAKQGYWQHKPVRGYRSAKINNSDGNPRPTMELNAEADKVKELLLLFNRGDKKVSEICRHATRIGLLNKDGKPLSQEVVTKMIQRPEYAGYVKDKFTDYKPVAGKHPALISEDVYNRNQELLKMKNKSYLIGLKHSSINRMAPLSRFIFCSKCHKYMTRSNPGGEYRYYCARVTCRGTGSIATEKAHEKFAELLTNITPKPNTLRLMKEILVRTSLKQLGNINEDLADMRNSLDSIADTRSKTLKKFIKDEITAEDKQVVVDELDAEKLELTQQISDLEQQQQISESNIEYALNFMADISKQWSDASFELKQKFQSLIFPEGFEYDIKNDNFIIHKISPLYGVVTPEIEADYDKNSVLVIPRRIEVTFRDPETSSLKTSFQEKISVRTAVRQFSPLSSLEIEVRLHKK